MATLTIKQVPETLYEQLKSRAQDRRRSLNAQVIHDLEAIVLEGRAADHAGMLRETRRLRERIDSPPLTDDILQAARQWGRQ